MGRPPKCHVTCTRFSNETFGEHEAWMHKYKRTGCVYGTPVQISPRVLPREWMIVIEMNNDTNRVVGVGLIQNTPSSKRYRIHERHSYNRYLYEGQYRILASQMTITERAVMWIMERILFYDAHHMKRGQGISLVPRTWEVNPAISFTNCLRQMFLSRWEFEPVPAEMRSWDEGKPVNRCGDLLSYCAEELCGRRRDDDDVEDDGILTLI